MIRKAVGAIVYKGNKFLLVGKVKLMEMPDGPVDMPLEWLLPGGGVLESDESDRKALKRELLEETGSSEFKIIKEFENRIYFNFPPQIRERTGFEKQETVMFLVEYIGTGEDLVPADEEISRVEFVTERQLLERILVKETKEFVRDFLKALSLEGTAV